MRAALVSASIAGFAAVALLVASTGQQSTRFRPLLRAAPTEAELVWPAGRQGIPARTGLLAPASTGALAVDRTFAGSTSTETTGDPPDPVIGVGDGFVVQMVNSSVRVWTTDGIPRATYPLATFMDATSRDVSDPSVVFDAASRRWFASAVDVGRAAVQVAVSGSADPTGPWRVYSHSSGSCPDQPSLGVSSRLVVVGYGAFSEPCRSAQAPTYLGGALFSYDKQQLVDGTAAEAADWGPRLEMSPVAAVSGAGSARAVGLLAPPAAEGPTYLALIGLEPTPTVVRVPIRPLAAPPAAAQAGTSETIDTNDARVLSAFVRRGVLWLAGNDGCIPARDRQLRSCLRLLAVSGNRISLDEDVGARGRNFFYPALAPARGAGVVVVHGFSSRSEDPGLAAFAITADRRPTRELTIATGTGPYLSDYFGAAADSSGAVWVTGEISVPPGGAGGSDASAANWATAIASVVLRSGR